MARKNGASGESAAPSVERSPLELPLVTLPASHPCRDCAQCCRYIATQIDDPTSFREYENLFWYLTHRDVSVYIDHDGDWYLEFRTECRHLSPSGTCGIYAERPQICETYSFEECEVTTREPGYRHRFQSYTELLDWLRAKRPRAYERYMRRRREMLKRRRQRTEGRRGRAAAS
jgi:Fe-S-cluster containining protein